ncbi:protein EMSY-LIKE 3-like isoform X1 [Primulina tabacum]|uniref:protein EMSY-LIKE 3-like isoform X1 n=1 Tax=Primulina tabacum TaxID=48773 RepID=UPI003F5A24EE
MEYEAIDSSGTDDDCPQLQYNRVPVGGRVTENGRAFVGLSSYQRMQGDMESQIHNLEKIAYGAVLRAFKAQSNALSWEKEGLITELRRELRVSDDEHRETLAEVNADELIQRIREWKEAVGNRSAGVNAPQHVNNQLPSPTISQSRKKQKTFQPGNQFGTSSQSFHPQSVTSNVTPLPSAVKRGPPLGPGGRRINAGQPVFPSAKPMQHEFVDQYSTGVPVDDAAESIRGPLIGRRVMIKWPADNNFYEALITDYNPADGRHSLVYDSNTPNATLEWVDIKEVPPEDIRWVGDNPLISRPGESGIQAGGGSDAGRGRISSLNHIPNEIQTLRNGVVKEDLGEIEILHTDTLINKVKKVLDASHPDELEMEKAKKMLKEHEQTLIEVIAKLSVACDSDSEHP